MQSNANCMYKIITVVVMIFMMSCDEKTSEVELLEKEVMAIHDDVMPKISDIHQSKKRLEIVLKNGGDSTTVFSLLKKLDDADETMMVWMNEYKPLASDVEESLKKVFFEEEKVKIMNVRDKILTSIEQVNTYADSFTNQEN